MAGVRYECSDCRSPIVVTPPGKWKSDHIHDRIATPLSMAVSLHGTKVTCGECKAEYQIKSPNPIYVSLPTRLVRCEGT